MRLEEGVAVARAENAICGRVVRFARRPVHTAEPVEQFGVAGEDHNAGCAQDRFALYTPRRALTIPPLIDVRHATGDCVAHPQPRGQALSHLTVCGNAWLRSSGPAASAAMTMRARRNIGWPSPTWRSSRPATSGG